MFGPFTMHNFKTVPKNTHEPNGPQNSDFAQDSAWIEFHAKFPTRALLRKAYISSYSYFYICTFICHCMFTSTITMVLACLTLEIIIVSYLTSPYNLPCFSTLRLCLQEFEEGVMKSTVSSQVQQQQAELATTSFKVRFSPILHQDGFSNSRYRRR